MKSFYATSLLLLALIQLLPAQDEKKEGWTYGLGLGADFAQMLLLNPRPGSGDNRIGLGGNINAFAKYNKGRHLWNNGANWLFSVQRIGSKRNPFQKNTDQLRLNSNYGFLLTDSSKFAYAVDATFLSQATPTFTGNLLKDTTSGNYGSISHFLAPATFQLSPGISYRPTKSLNFLISPASVKMVIVADDRLANLPNADGSFGLLGNPWRADGDFDRVDLQVGGMLIATYANKYFKDRIGITSRLSLYSNYLRSPQYIDVEWLNSLDFFIIKGLSINLALNLLYDYDIPVLVDLNDNGVYEAGETGRRPFLTEALLIKYNVLF